MIYNQRKVRKINRQNRRSTQTECRTDKTDKKGVEQTSEKEDKEGLHSTRKVTPGSAIPCQPEVIDIRTDNGQTKDRPKKD